jgi:hypothetical protein
MNLETYQRQFAAYIRQPEGAPPAVVTRPERLDLYRELLFHNVCSFIDVCLPISRRCLSEAGWHALQTHFFAQARCQTPYFREIPQAFVDWLFDEARDRLVEEPDHLPYLAHYEWLELAVDTHPDGPQVSGLQPWQPELDAPVVIAPSLRAVCYPFPVHTIRPGAHVPMQTTWLMCWRDDDGVVHFGELNGATHALLLRLQQGPLTPSALADGLSQTLNMAIATQHVVAELQSLADQGVVMGMLASPPLQR